MYKKILSVLLAMVLTFALLPLGTIVLATGEVCEIGSKQYMTLGEALADATAGNTIKLLADIDYNAQIAINGITITFDLNGYNLNVTDNDVNHSAALLVTNGWVKLAGTGEFNVTGVLAGARASNGIINITNASSTSGTAAYAENGSRINVSGNVTGYAVGAYATGTNSKVVVSGDASCSGNGGRSVEADSGGYIEVNSATATGAGSMGAHSVNGTIMITQDATGAGWGAYAYGTGGTISIGRNAIATENSSNSCGARADRGGQITVGGYAQGAYSGVKTYNEAGDAQISTIVVEGYAKGTGTGINSVGITTEGGGNVTVKGNAQGELYGALASGANVHVTVKGDAIATGTLAAGASASGGGNITIEGNAKGVKYGVIASGIVVQGLYSTAYVKGNVEATAEADGIGAWASNNGEITVDGVITAPVYIQLYYTVKDASQTTTPTTKPGYYTYSDGGSNVVWVKEAGMTDAQKVAADKAALTFDTIRGTNSAENNIIADLATLPLLGANGSAIGWSSTSPSEISLTGLVTRPASGSGDKAVTLTATITSGGASDTISFNLTVKELPSTGNNLDLNWHSALDTNGAIAGNITHVVSGNGGRIIAINGNGKIISSEDSGQHWVPCSTGDFVPRDIAYDGTRFIAAGNGIMTSSDGLVWMDSGADVLDWSIYSFNAVTAAHTSKGWITVACGNHGLILVSYADVYDTWLKLNIGNPNAEHVAFVDRFSYVPAHTASGGFNIPEEFIGFGDGSIYKITAFIGEDTFRSVSSSSDTTIAGFNKVWYENAAEMFYATVPIGYEGTTVEFMSSSNMNTWTDVDTYNTIRGFASNGAGIYVKVGNGGTIMTSVDGTNWNSQTVGSATLNDIAFADGIFVAVGNNGTILTSSDGVAWHTCTSGTSASLSSVAYANGAFVAGGNGAILYSGEETPSVNAPPAWPSSSTLTASNVGQTSLTLTWSGATDNVGVTGYKILKDDILYTTVGNILTTGVTGLTAGTQYTFKVEACDAAGNWSSAGPSAAVTTAEAPVPPQTPTISPNGGTFAGSTTVTITGSGGTVYYTTDGSSPITSSTQYTAPFTLSQSATVTAAVYSSNEWSGVASATFTITASPIPAPLVNTMTVDTTGIKLSITFDKAISDPSGKHGSFLVTADNQPVTVSSAVYGSNSNTIDLTIGQVYQGQTVKVAYTGAAGVVTSSDGGVLAVFPANTYTVANNSTVAIPSSGSNPPTWPAGSTLTASGTTKTRTSLSWTAAADDAGVTGYRIYQDSSLIQTVTGAVYGYEVTGLSTSTTYTFRVQAGDVDNNWTYGPTVTVRTASSGGIGGGGGSSTPAPTPEPKPAAQVHDSSGNISETITLKLDNSTGTATVEVNSASLTNAFDKSKADDKGIKTIEVNIPKINGAKAYEAILPASFLTSSDATKAVKIKTAIAAVTLPGNMITAANAGAQNVSLTIAAGDKSKLAADIQTQIGSRPVIELSLKIDGKQTSWSNEGAPVTVTIPYTPAAEELKDPEHITVWYIDGSGNAVSVPSGRYDPATGKVTFSTTHFSNYAVVYVTNTFDDLGSVAWAKTQIEILASKGILKGISEKEYAPSTSITRADFLYYLVRTLGVDAKVDGSFEDISSDAYYYKEIGIAKKLGITSGTGNSKFNPDASITRQDMMVLTERALRMLQKLKEQGTASNMDKFADKSLIAAYAVDSVASVVKEGLIVGSSDMVNPLGNTTRAEAAVFLYRIYNKY